MEETKDETLVCGRCRNEVAGDDEFCTHCGSILIEEVMCDRHPQTPAEGVCLICSTPYCKRCGAFLNDIFLCEAHAHFEIIEGMVRVYGDLNDTPAQYAKSCLEQAGLHPTIFCRVQPLGGPRFVYTLYRAAGDYDGHVINEIKVMVPCEEVIEAEKILKELKISE
jgi:hypothetical protein